MVDSIVSVRMPSSLVQKLKFLSKENHFIDVSEEMRSIIKIKTREYKIKIGSIEDKHDKHIEKEPKDFKTENQVKEELLKRLKQMIKDLEKDN